MKFLLSIIVSTLIVVSPFKQANGQVMLAKQKAAFLYNFTHYIKWPDKKDNFKICLSKTGAVYEHLSKIASSKSVISIAEKSVENASCNIAYYDAHADSLHEQTFEPAMKQGMLTVSDKQGFTQGDGLIEFFEKAGKLRVRINIESVEKMGFKVDPRLLQLADRVK